MKKHATLLASLTAVLASCSDAPCEVDGRSSQVVVFDRALIGPEGGELALPTGGKLQVPRAALSEAI